MVWILYPSSFEAKVNVPEKEELIEYHINDQEYPQLLSKLVKRESKRTPGCGVLIREFTQRSTYNTFFNNITAYSNGFFTTHSRQAARDNEFLTVKELEYRPTEDLVQPKALRQGAGPMSQVTDRCSQSGTETGAEQIT